MVTLHDRPREDWEQPGFRVAEHTTSLPVRKRLLTSVVLHYPGTNSDVGRDTAARLRATQRYYAQARGYSIGYNYVCDPDGVLWEARGLYFQNAANKGSNNHTVSVQLLVKGQAAATAAQVARVQRFVREVREWCGEDLDVVPHRSVSATQCPGEGIMTQLRAGLFEPAAVELPVGKELEMKLVSPPVRVFDSRDAGSKFGDGETRRVPVGDVDAVFVNLTVTQQNAGGYLTAWGAGSIPDVSNVNYGNSGDICNTSWVPVVDGHINVFAYRGCHVIVDVQATA